MKKIENGFQTECIWGKYNPHVYHGSMSPPIYQSSLFALKDYDTCLQALWEHQHYFYSRINNPTHDVLEAQVAHLEGGEMALAFSSGCAAISSVIFSCLKKGDHVIAPYYVYGETYRLLAGYLPRFGITTTFIEGTDLNQYKKSLRPKTRLIYLESPSSGYFYLQPIEEITALARRHKITTVIDNSLATPYNQQPFKMGVDFVLHSMSKYIGGHSDIVAGILVGRAKEMRKIRMEEREIFGGALAPFDTWLALRGLRTLGVRMQSINSAGLAIAGFLEKHSKVKRVYYPGLPSHPHYQLAIKQMSGFSGLITIELKNRSLKSVKRFLNSLKIFKLAVSWGGFDSLALPILPLPGKFLFGKITKTDRLRQFPVGTIRLSIGLENIEDLMKDLNQALSKV
ncbi:MAG: PLP-dependent aspartate aminotransferase family protein [Planctomycetota bacterium]